MAKQKQSATSVAETVANFTTAPNEAMKDVLERATSMSGDLGEVTRGNMEAMSQSFQLAGKGMAEFNAKALSFMQENFKHNLDTVKTLSGLKSPEDLSSVTDMTKARFEAYVGQMNELGTMFAGALRQAVEPLNAQAGVVVEKFQASA